MEHLPTSESTWIASFVKSQEALEALNSMDEAIMKFLTSLFGHSLPREEIARVRPSVLLSLAKPPCSPYTGTNVHGSDAPEFPPPHRQASLETYLTSTQEPWTGIHLWNDQSTISEATANAQTWNADRALMPPPNHSNFAQSMELDTVEHKIMTSFYVDQAALPAGQISITNSNPLLDSFAQLNQHQTVAVHNKPSPRKYIKATSLYHPQIGGDFGSLDGSGATFLDENSPLTTSETTLNPVRAPPSAQRHFSPSRLTSFEPTNLTSFGSVPVSGFKFKLSSPSEAQGSISTRQSSLLNSMASEVGDSLSEYQSTNGEGNMFRCEEEGCYLKFKYQWKYEDHKRSHSEKREFRCEICNSDFKHSRDLIKHEKSSKKHAEVLKRLNPGAGPPPLQIVREYPLAGIRKFKKKPPGPPAKPTRTASSAYGQLQSPTTPNTNFPQASFGRTSQAFSFPQTKASSELYRRKVPPAQYQADLSIEDYSEAFSWSSEPKVKTDED